MSHMCCASLESVSADGVRSCFAFGKLLRSYYTTIWTVQAAVTTTSGVAKLVLDVPLVMNTLEDAIRSIQLV
jgi:hypothetical protein